MAITGSIIAGTYAAAAGTTALSAFLFTSYIGGFLVSTVMGAALQALAPKPSSADANRGYQTNALGPAQDHSVIYGKARVGGAIIYDEATGTNNKFLHRLIAVAGHEIEGFDRIYINDEYIDVADIEADGNVPLVYASDGVETSTKYNDKMRIRLHLGAADQTADTDLVWESWQWTTEHRLRGIAYIYLRLSFDADTYQNGVPTITAAVKGKKVYDPRSGLTAWSDNAALCNRDYLASSYGLNEATDNIDDTLVAAAANICDQTSTDAGTARYTCNGSFTTSATPYDIISNLLTSMGGSLWYAQGKWRMKSAAWSATVMDLDEGDLRSSIGVSTRHSRRDNFNTIKGTFRGEETNWQTTDYPQVTNAAFLAADNGQESVADVDLPFTDNSIEARRLALISLERNRQQLTVTASFGLRTLELQIGDNVRLTNARFGWVNKEFECIQWTFGLVDDLDLQVQMVLRETAETVFDEVADGIVYERDNTALLSPFSVPAVGLSAVARTQVFREKLTNIITLNVTSGAGERVDTVEVGFRKSTDTDYISLGTGQLGDFEAMDLEDGNYDFRARAINTFGIKGEFEYLTNFNASGLLAPPSDVANLTAEVNGSVITLDWDAVSDLDLSFYRIRYTPDLSGATWANAVTYVNKIPRPASAASVPARAGTYLIRAYDKSGIASINATATIVPPANIETFATSLSLTDSTTFTGTKTGTAVVTSTLRLSSYATAPASGDYFFSNYIQTSSSDVKRCRVYVSAATLRHDASAGLFDDQGGLFDDGAGLFDDLGGSSQFADTDIIALVSTTQDDPAGTPTWSSYSRINVADISARAFRFKIQLSSTADNITPSVTALTAYVEYD